MNSRFSLRRFTTARQPCHATLSADWKKCPMAFAAASRSSRISSAVASHVWNACASSRRMIFPSTLSTISRFRDASRYAARQPWNAPATARFANRRTARSSFARVSFASWVNPRHF